MCDAKTHLFYGLPVRTWSLVPAADAWPKLVKTLPFFDLLNLRIRSGTLQASKQDGTGSSAIERVPVEVWNVVKHKLVDLELQDANDQLMRNIDVNMWSCWGAGVRKPGKSNADSALPPFWTDICREADPYPDHSCPHWIDMWLTHMWSAEDFKKLQDLLKVFKLCAPSQRPLMRTDDRWTDLYSATYIALLSSCTTMETDCGYTDPDEQRLLRIDPDAMRRTTEGALQRFLRFLRFFRIEPLQVATTVSTRPGRGSNMVHRERLFTALPIDEVQPKWLMLNVSAGGLFQH